MKRWMLVSIDKMNLQHLKDRVVREGYGHLLFTGGPNLELNDFRIEKAPGLFPKWRVCDYERGAITRTHLETTNEADACVFWYEGVGRMMLLLRRWPTNDLAERAESTLNAAGIPSIRNDLPDDPAFKGLRYRTFVAGRDLARGAIVVATLT